MAPGDVRDIKYSYKNTGSLSIDTRITYIMNYKQNEDFQGKLENIATLTDGENVLTLKEQDSRMTIDGPTIKGTGEDEGVESMDKTVQFKLLEEVPNGAQDMEFTIDVIIEGKQNKNGAEWGELNTKTIIIHGNEVKVVEASACNTPDYTAYFKFSEVSGGYAIDGFVDNVEEILKEDGVDPGFRYNPILPSEYSGKPVTELGKSAFRGNKLTSVVIPDSVTAIGSEALNWNQLTSVVIPDSVTKIGSSAFRTNKLTSVVIPDSVAYIDYGAFTRNELTSVVIPDSVTRIGGEAFSENQLTSIDIPSSVTRIDSGAFSNNELTSLVIPDSVTKVGHWAFSNNELTSLVIPDSVTEIEEGAFRANKLTSVKIPDTVTSIGMDGFFSNQLTSVVIPDSVTSIGREAFYSNKLTSVKLGSSVTEIEFQAFALNDLTSVVIPDSVTEIGGRAFAYNRLTSVVIPDSVTTIGETAFFSRAGEYVYANELEGDSWPTLREYVFESNWSLKPLSEYEK